MFFHNKGEIGEFVKKENVLIKVLLCVPPLVFIFIPYYDLFFLSPYNWHIRQPQVWQGSLELLLFAVFISVAAIIRKRFSLPLLVFSAIYMLMNGVLLPFFYPDKDVKEKRISIFVDGKSSASSQLQYGFWNCEVDVPSGASKIELKSNYLMESSNSDERRLCVILSDIKLVEFNDGL